MSADRPEPPRPGHRDREAYAADGRTGIEEVGEAGVLSSGKVAPSSRQRHELAHGGLSLFTPGSHVGRYRLLAPLASGGMAQVWAAKPEGSGFARTVALKLIRQDYAADEEYARMFVDEATVAASIRHPNVCETYELGRQDGVLFMAIEWVAGDSLAGILHRNQGLDPIPMPLAARIVADACAGLHAAHEAVGPDGALLGVVHRDVSPPNILLSLQGQVKVSDFGIAKARFQLHSRTRTGEIKGKFAYIAPEQIGGKNIDRRVDLFALGCVLYVATVGLRPFGSGPRAMSKILAGEYKRPSSLIEAYPVELENVIARCLQKSPADRYNTAEDMRMDLERWLMTSQSPVGMSELAAFVSQRLDPEKRKVVETLMRSNQFLPEAMVYQLVRGEVEQTPTATSSVVFGPGSETDVETAEPSSRAAPKTRSKPMVRFSALGRPITPESLVERPRHESARANSISSEEMVPDDEAPTMFHTSRASRQHPSDAASRTHRPPRLAPLHVDAGQSLGLRGPIWIAIGVLITIGLGWASCQLLPP
ncbi:MAG TPA: serine/threonine-protein kinase [Polyangiaceae bacterium]|nr:serine/threonine-protein kinase [Polyangiaceae bacterium]